MKVNFELSSHQCHSHSWRDYLPKQDQRCWSGLSLQTVVSLGFGRSSRSRGAVEIKPLVLRPSGETQTSSSCCRPGLEKANTANRLQQLRILCGRMKRRLDRRIPFSRLLHFQLSFLFIAGLLRGVLLSRPHSLVVGLLRSQKLYVSISQLRLIRYMWLISTKPEYVALHSFRTVSYIICSSCRCGFIKQHSVTKNDMPVDTKWLQNEIVLLVTRFLPVSKQNVQCLLLNSIFNS